MPMRTNGSGRLSRRGRWRESYEVLLSGRPIEAIGTVFEISLLSEGARCVCRDYGRACGRENSAALRASTNDGTERIVAVYTERSILLTWQFSAIEMRALSTGAFRCSILASIAGETDEIANFVRVVV